MDPLPQLIGHHTSVAGVGVELGVIVAIAGVFGLAWWRGKRRRERKPPAEMRD